MINDWLSYIKCSYLLTYHFNLQVIGIFILLFIFNCLEFFICPFCSSSSAIDYFMCCKKIIFTIGRKTDVWYAIDLDTGIKQQTLKLDGTETVCPMMSNKRAPVFLGRTGTLIDLHFISPSYICSIFLQIKKMIYFKMVS